MRRLRLIAAIVAVTGGPPLEWTWLIPVTAIWAGVRLIIAWEDLKAENQPGAPRLADLWRTPSVLWGLL